MEVSDVTGAATAAQTSGASSRNSLSQEDFLEIMIAELVNQDPLEPMDNNQFLDQLTQLQNLEATTKLTEGIEALVLGQQISSAGVLIGQEITGVSSDGEIVEGLVTKVTVNDGDVLVGIEGHDIPLSLVRQVNAPQQQVPEE